jgi:hypothetical protein
METDEGRAAELMDTDDVVAAVGGMAGGQAGDAPPAAGGSTPSYYPGWHPHVGECVAHAARLLESLLGNADFAGQVRLQDGPLLCLPLHAGMHQICSGALLCDARGTTKVPGVHFEGFVSFDHV